MYSPSLGGAACRPSAIIDKKQASNRRFIICCEKDYLRGSDIAQAVAVIGEYCEERQNRGAWSRRASRRNRWQLNGPGRAVCRPFPTNLDPLRRAPDLPTFAASGSEQTYR